MSTGRQGNLSQVKEKVELVECDLGKPGTWQSKLQDVTSVFHLAALADIVPSIQRPEDYFRANVDGTFNLLEACRRYGVERVVYAASSSGFGIPDNYPTDEVAEIRPEYPYALTKNIGEQLVLHWSKIYRLPATSLRLFNVYGPRARTGGTYGAVFGVFLAQKLHGKPFTIVGSGEQTRDFTYVEDVVDAMVAASAEQEISTVYNVGSGTTVSINRIVELLGGEKVYIPKRPGEPDCTFADVSKINRELGWKPKVCIEEGVKRLLEEIDYWSDAPVWTPESIQDATEDWFRYLGEAS